MKNNKTLLRIVVPMLIVLAAGGAWLLKNSQRAQRLDTQLEIAQGNPAFVLEDTTFDLDAYAAHGLPMILDFGAEECGPCQVMRPALEAAHKQNLGRGLIKFFDVWKRPELTAGYPIMVVPSQVLLNADGTPYQPSEKVLASGLNLELFDHRDTGEHSLTMHIGILNEEQFRLLFEDMGVTYDD